MAMHSCRGSGSVAVRKELNMSCKRTGHWWSDGWGERWHWDKHLTCVKCYIYGRSKYMFPLIHTCTILSLSHKAMHQLTVVKIRLSSWELLFGRRSGFDCVWRDTDLCTAFLGALQGSSSWLQCSVTLHSLTAEVHQVLHWLSNCLMHFTQICCGRPSLSLTFTSSRSANQEASFGFTAQQLNRATACLVGIAAQHRRHKEVAQNTINWSVVSQVRHRTHKDFERHNGTHPHSSMWLLILIKRMSKQWIPGSLSSPPMSLGMRLYVADWWGSSMGTA